MDSEDAWRKGFVPLMRNLDGHPIMSDPFTLAVYVRLAYRARFGEGLAFQRAPGHWKELPCEVGQCVFGRDELAAKLRAKPGRVRRALERLAQWGLVTVESTKLGSIATVRHYAWFWTKGAYSEPSGDTTAAPRSEGQALGDFAAMFGATKGNTPKQETGHPTQERSCRAQARGCWSEAGQIQKAWEQTEGDHAAQAYVAEGLSRARDPQRAATRVMREINEALEDAEVGPFPGQSLWKWFQARTDVWLGSDTIDGDKVDVG